MDNITNLNKNPSKTPKSTDISKLKSINLTSSPNKELFAKFIRAKKDREAFEKQGGYEILDKIARLYGKNTLLYLLNNFSIIYDNKKLQDPTMDNILGYLDTEKSRLSLRHETITYKPSHLSIYKNTIAHELSHLIFNVSDRGILPSNQRGRYSTKVSGIGMDACEGLAELSAMILTNKISHMSISYKRYTINTYTAMKELAKNKGISAKKLLIEFGKHEIVKYTTMHDILNHSGFKLGKELGIILQRLYDEEQIRYHKHSNEIHERYKSGKEHTSFKELIEANPYKTHILSGKSVYIEEAPEDILDKMIKRIFTELTRES